MFCKYCGKEIKDDSVFCKHCGKKFINSNLQFNSKDATSDLNRENEPIKEEMKIKQTNHKRTFKSKILIILICLFIVTAAIGGLIWLNYTGKQKITLAMQTENSKTIVDTTATPSTPPASTTIPDISPMPTTTLFDNLDQKQFSLAGTVNGDKNIHMNISLNKGEITGTYYYDKYNTNIEVTGSYDKDNNIILNEFYDGKNTGTFNGEISYNGDFKGTWSSSDRTKELPFVLAANN